MTKHETTDYNFLQWKNAKLSSFYQMRTRAEADYVKASRAVDALFAKYTSNDPTFNNAAYIAAREKENAARNVRNHAAAALNNAESIYSIEEYQKQWNR